MTKQESANEYTKYIDEHINNVKKAFNEYAPILCGLLVIYDGNYTSKEDVHNDPDINDEINQLYMQLTKQVQHHDSSKYNIEEFKDNIPRQIFTLRIRLTDVLILFSDNVPSFTASLTAS